MIWNIGIVNGEVPWSILRLKMHIDDMRKCAPSSFHQIPGPNSIDGHFKHKKMSSNWDMIFFWAKGNQQFPVESGVYCVEMFAFYSMHVFWYLSISFFTCSSSIYSSTVFFCHTGWNPFFSSSLRYAGAWRRFLRQQAQWFPRWNHPRSLQKWVEAMVDDFFLFFLLNGLDKDTMMMKTNTTTVGSCEIISHDIHL